MSFKQQLSWGKTGESIVSQYFQHKGYAVLPVYEKIIDEGKGPQLFMLDKSIVAPDMLITTFEQTYWIESKRKTAFTFHRNTGRWTTGIDLRHYIDYLTVAKRTPWPVWLLFLQGDGVAKDSPPNRKPPEPGLYGNNLITLKDCENHRSDKHGQSGMVYWCVKSLKHIASTSDLESLDGKFISCTNGHQGHQGRQITQHVQIQLPSFDQHWQALAR